MVRDKKFENEAQIRFNKKNMNDPTGNGITPSYVGADSDDDYKKAPNTLGQDWVVGGSLADYGWNIDNAANVNTVLSIITSEDGHDIVIKFMGGDTNEYIYKTITSQATIAISMWLKVENVSNGDSHLRCYSLGGGTYGCGIKAESATQTWWIWRNAAWVDTNVSISLDKWHHIACYYDDTNCWYKVNGIQIYKNTTTDNGSIDRIYITNANNNNGEYSYWDAILYGTSTANIFTNVGDGHIDAKSASINGSPKIKGRSGGIYYPLDALDIADYHWEASTDDDTTKIKLCLVSGVVSGDTANLDGEDNNLGGGVIPEDCIAVQVKLGSTSTIAAGDNAANVIKAGNSNIIMGLTATSTVNNRENYDSGIVAVDADGCIEVYYEVNSGDVDAEIVIMGYFR